MRTEFIETGDGARLRLVAWPEPEGAHRVALVLGGRTECAEKYEEASADLAARGFAVWSADWRGHGLSSRLAADPVKGHIDDFAIYCRDLALVLAAVAGRAGGAPLTVLAHSMGGHVLMRLLAAGGATEVGEAAITAPMLGIGPRGLPAATMAALARGAVLLGRGEGYAPGQSGDLGRRTRFEGNRVTSDPRHFAAQARLLTERPDLMVGGATWGWLDAALRSCDKLNRPEVLRRIRIPLLIAMAGRDVIVDNAAIRRAADLIPGARLHVFPQARHEILQERDEIRAEFWRAFDAFTADRQVMSASE